jgi:hypothetical protein
MHWYDDDDDDDDDAIIFIEFFHSLSFSFFHVFFFLSYLFFFFFQIKKLKKAFVDTDDESWTPLHVAAANGSNDLVASLLHGGSMCEAKTYHGWRPLHLAAASAHAYCVGLLLKHPKCDPNWVTDSEKQVYILL